MKTDTQSPKRPRTDPGMRPVRWAKSRRSKEAQLARAVRADLARHIGGKPSAAEDILISRITMLLVHLAHLDERALKDGGLYDHAGRQYLAWHSTVTKKPGRGSHEH